VIIHAIPYRSARAEQTQAQQQHRKHHRFLCRCRTATTIVACGCDVYVPGTAPGEASVKDSAALRGLYANVKVCAVGDAAAGEGPVDILAGGPGRAKHGWSRTTGEPEIRRSAAHGPAVSTGRRGRTRKIEREAGDRSARVVLEQNLETRSIVVDRNGHRTVEQRRQAEGGAAVGDTSSGHDSKR